MEPNFVLSHRPFGQSSYGNVPLSPRTSIDFQNENVLDSMEKEQEGIVMRMMREIDLLREENRHLRLQLSKQAAVVSSSGLVVASSKSSISSQAPYRIHSLSSSTSSISSQAPYRMHSLSSSTSSISSQSSNRAHNGIRSSSKCDTLTNRKRLPSTSGQSPISPTTSRYPNGLDISPPNRAQNFKKCRNMDRELRTKLSDPDEMFMDPFNKSTAKHRQNSSISASSPTKR